MGIVFTQSADKHDVPNGDALYAIANAVYSSERVRGERDTGARMVFIGPPHAQTERLLEVLIERRAGDFIVFHVMPLGDFYTRQMEGDR